MKKKLLVIFLLSFEILPSNQITMAESQTNVVEKFIQALINRDEKLINKSMTSLCIKKWSEGII